MPGNASPRNPTIALAPLCRSAALPVTSVQAWTLASPRSSLPAVRFLPSAVSFAAGYQRSVIVLLRRFIGRLQGSAQPSNTPVEAHTGRIAVRFSCFSFGASAGSVVAVHSMTVLGQTKAVV